MAKYIPITEKEFHLLHFATDEKLRLAEGAECEDYIRETKKLLRQLTE